jgi:hypothetical protein
MDQAVQIFSEHFVASKTEGKHRHAIDKRASSFQVKTPDAFSSGIEKSLPLMYLLLLLRYVRSYLTASHTHPRRKLPLLIKFRVKYDADLRQGGRLVGANR